MSFTNIKNLNNIGLQKICVDSSGKDKENIYVCDSEGVLLKFNKESLLSDETPETTDISDTTTAAIAWCGENICIGYSKVDFIAGTEKQVVGRAKRENFDADAITDPLEFQLAVTTVDANEENVVAGSSDYAVKCTNLKDPDAELKTISLEGEPLCVKLDPRNEFVAVSTVDGNVTIINIDDFSIAHTLKDVFPKFETIDVSKPLIQMVWSKDGTWLFIPSKDCVKSYRRGTWEDAGVYRLKDQESAKFSVLALSQCGTFLAAASVDNKVAVWNNELMKLVACQEFKRNAPGTTVITSIAFAPFAPKQLIIADSNKGICMFDAFGASTSSAASDEKMEVDAAADSDDDSIVLNRTAAKNNLLNDEAMDDDEDTRMSSDLAAIKKRYGYGNEDLGGLEEFGFQVGKPDENLRPMTPQGGAPAVPSYIEPSAPRKVLIPERFVCNSSPVNPEATQRFLKYNRYGVVRSYVNESAKVASIDIEFHNKNIHGDINIDNFDANYELADISENVVALASTENRKKEKELDKATDEIEDLETDAVKAEKQGTSILHVIPIQGFDPQRWTIVMPRGDGIVDVLVSKKQVVVLTKKRNIRVFTICGVQRQIFTHPAPILTATCFDDRLAIASVSGSEFYEHKKTPQWRFEVTEYSLNQRSWYREPRHSKSAGAVSRFDVPVETGEQLDWIAYSSQGKLAVMDSAANVHVLSAPGLWVPVFQGSSVLRAPSDGIFPVCITAKEFRYIYCRGSRSPLVNGINAPTTVDWKLPFCQPEKGRTELEHSLYLSELLLSDAILERDANKNADASKQLASNIIKLFALLTKTNSDGLAAEVAALVNGNAASKTIQNLCNYAVRCKKVALSEKVAEIGRRIVDGDDGRRSEEPEIRPARIIATSKFASKARKAPSPVEQEGSDDEEQEAEETRPSPDLDMSISTEPVVPMEKAAKNPFAKGSEKSAPISAASSQLSLSIFDQLESTSNDTRKRVRETDASVSTPPTRKQAKLNFGSSTGTDETRRKAQEKKNGKENEAKAPETQQPDVEEPTKKSVSPYELWLMETKTSLRADFDGDEADFSKFCIQTFRGLSKDEKNEWKEKAVAQKSM